MRLKKLLAFALACSLSLSLYACKTEAEGEGEEEPVYLTDTEGKPVVGEDGEPVTVPPETESTTTTPDPNAPLYTKVGFIYPDTVKGDPQAASFEKARKDIEVLLGVETCYMEQVLVQQFPDAVEVLREEGVNVIVAASNHYAAAVDKAAKNETGGIRYIVYGSKNYAANEASLQPSLYQPANVCGTVAAFNTVVNKIGVVADNNLFNANAIVDAFTLGVRDVPVINLAVEINLAWALSDSNTDTKRAIDSLVKAGNDIIFIYQSNEYGIKYCEQIGVKVIAFAPNLPELAPTQYLTGFYLNLNTYIVNCVQKARHDAFDGGLNTDGLKYGLVAMVKLNNEACRAGTADISESQYDFVSNGQNPVFVGEVRDRNNKIQIDKGVTLPSVSIFQIDWLEKTITSVENYSAPRGNADLVFSDLAVKYTKF
ncbi:MAG: BMP family ABC transporter substrate-binding protein [Oscillospiraceae bacterium]|jgi:basic membrane lipoprotein Med (substrate-binding protein (PBP1-ABC) superfamily)|nr:BMP family ABC transporter substrate-binding protein [Oscillospiraceae bacterium]